MKRLILLYLALTAYGCIFSTSSAIAQSNTRKVYTVVERQPEYPGGAAALSHYLATTIRISGALIRKQYDTGPVAAKFIIDEFGYVHDVRVTTKPLDKKMLKVMQGYMASIISAVEKMPRWQPGEVDGRAVAVFYTLPIEVTMR